MNEDFKAAADPQPGQEQPIQPDIATKKEQEMLEAGKAPAPALTLEPDSSTKDEVDRLIEQQREQRIAYLRDRRQDAHERLRGAVERSFPAKLDKDRGDMGY